MKMFEINQEIVTTARGWIGTRFHHQGRLKKSEFNKGGVDCLGLLVGVAAELNLPYVEYDEINYTHYPDSEKLRKKLAQIMQEIPITEISSGNILLLSIDNNPQHLGIVGDLSGTLSIIHSYAPARGVVEHILDAWWQLRIVSAFRIKQ